MLADYSTYVYINAYTKVCQWVLYINYSPLIGIHGKAADAMPAIAQIHKPIPADPYPCKSLKMIMIIIIESKAARPLIAERHIFGTKLSLFEIFIAAMVDDTTSKMRMKYPMYR